MHNVSGFISVFESSKTVQYSRRHRRSKSAQNLVAVFAVTLPCRGLDFPTNAAGDSGHASTRSSHRWIAGSKGYSFCFGSTWFRGLYTTPPSIKLWSRNSIVFRFSFAVTLSRLPMITAVSSVHILSQSHHQCTPGTFLLLNVPRSSSKPAQVSSSHHFKVGADLHLQETRCHFFSLQCQIQLSAVNTSPSSEPGFAQIPYSSPLATNLLLHARRPGFESPLAR
jgi:hypothetical protein